MAPAVDPAAIALYHAHVYYDPASRGEAGGRREGRAAALPGARRGRRPEQPVGPHPQAMYQVAFAADRLAAILPWLMLNRGGLTILVHPETGDAWADHARHAAWLGGILPLDLDRLRPSPAA
jgi:DOPA 4,5-dioxygenase